MKLDAISDRNKVAAGSDVRREKSGAIEGGFCAQKADELEAIFCAEKRGPGWKRWRAKKTGDLNNISPKKEGGLGPEVVFGRI